jgi:hypothetical protein
MSNTNRFDQLVQAKVSAESSHAGSAESSSSSRFEQLLKAKLAAEQRTVETTPPPSFVAPIGFDAALAKMRSAETVFNRDYVSQHYTEPIASKSGPTMRASIPNESIPAPVSQNRRATMPAQPQPSFYSYAASEQPVAGPIPHQYPVSPSAPAFEIDPNTLGSEQLAASFRSMVSERINTMYAEAQRRSPRPPTLQIPDQQPAFANYPASPIRSVDTLSPQTPSYPQMPSQLVVATSPSIPQAPMTPAHSYNGWNEQSNVKVETDWQGPPPYNSTPYSAHSVPFMWNVTPPQNQNHQAVDLSMPPAPESTASVSPLTPVTPQMISSPFTQLVPPMVDVKPVISPASSTISLPSESLTRYGPGLFVNMNGQAPVYRSASNGEANGNGEGMYNGEPGGLDNSSIGGSGLEGLGFSNGGGGEDGEGEDYNHQEDDHGGDDGSGPSEMPRRRSKKLSLACHFCRRRKLK